MSMRAPSCHFLNLLPEELLIQIVYLSTGGSSIDAVVNLPPFETIISQSEELKARYRLQTKRALASTNSKLRRLVLPSLYEDVWVHHGAEALLRGLHHGAGKYVKRIFIPHSHQVVKPDIFRNIVEACPELQVLTRLSSNQKAQDFCPLANVTFNADALKHLARIDWNNVPMDDMHTSVVSPSFIWSLPSLQVLTLGSRNFHDFEGLQGANNQSLEIVQTEIKLDLPNVHTLRLRTLDALGDPFSHWYSAKFPSLRRVVLEAPAGLYPFYEGCLTFYGSRIEAIEFTADNRFLRVDGIALALFYCPNVTELYFPVFNTMAPKKNSLASSETEHRYYKVERIVMHAFVESDAGYRVSRSWMTTHFADHVDGLCGEGSRFTALKTLVLFGSEWQELVRDTFIRSLLDVVSEKGILIEHREL